MAVGPSARKPVIDGRRREDLLRYLRETAPYYTDRWSPDAGDVGAAVATLFAEIAEDVTERVDRLPEKHFVAFLDAVGFDRLSPQPARLPLTVSLVDGAERNVTIPAGTQAVSEATETRPESTFEVEPGDAFEATPASLVGAYSVDPAADQLFDHLPALSADRETTLFGEADAQSHALYLGHTDLLDLKPGGQVTVTFDVPDSAAGYDPGRVRGLLDRLEWAYYGTEGEGDEEEVGWHALKRVDSPKVPPEEVALVREALDALEGTLLEAGYERVPLTTAARSGLVDRVAVDVFDRREFLPPHLLPTEGVDEAVATAVRQQFAAALQRFESEAGRSDAATHSFTVGGTPGETIVGGVSSRWLRVRVPEGRVSRALFDVVFEGVSLAVGPPTEGRIPDAMFANDVPLPVPGAEEIDGDVWTGTVRPFGELPQLFDSFAIASDEAFSKRGSTVTLEFEGGETTHPIEEDLPTLSWEYWNGAGWARLDVEGGAASDTLLLGSPDRSFSVSFPVPEDLQPTTVLGREAHWIRARLVEGDYGSITYTENDGTWIPSDSGVNEPTFTSLRVRFGGPTSVTPNHVLTENALVVEEVTSLVEDNGHTVQPFVPLRDRTQTLYLAFDRPLEAGPVHLFVSPADRAYLESFYPRVRWEYCTDPDADRWVSPSVVDGSEGLVERGIVRLTFPEPTVESERFGRRANWLRGRVDGNQFVGTLYRPESGGPTSGRASQSESESESECGCGCGRASTALEPCRATVPTAPPAGVPSKHPPTLVGLYPNTTWASNVRTVERERLGTSDGRPSQSFVVASPPVVEAGVWVDELTTLPDDERAALSETAPEDVEDERALDGELQRFWVRWTPVEDFLDSGPTDRHYELDRLAGTVTFGDGTAGRIPPVGAVRSTYLTGGGAAGNVPAGDVTSLVSSVAFVDSVANPEAGDGGADAETTEAVLDRGPRELRDRNRAVAAVDVERLALAASRKVARAACLPAMDRGGAFRPGWATLVLVPKSGAPNPMPSAELGEAIGRYVGERAPVALVDPDRLVVRGPSYVAATVEATLVTVPSASIATVEAEATAAVTAYLHPLTGGPDGGGWAFGHFPCRADLYDLFEGLSLVDHVRTLTLRFEGAGRTVTAVEGEDTPSVSADALVYSGQHDLSAVGGR